MRKIMERNALVLAMTILVYGCSSTYSSTEIKAVELESQQIYPTDTTKLTSISKPLQKIVIVKGEAREKFAIGSEAEWQDAKLVLTHSPEDELYYGLLQPDAALFNYAFNQDAAIQEHSKYRTLMQQAGATVLTTTDVLRATPEPQLRQFAQQFFTLDVCDVLGHDGLTTDIQKQIKEHKVTRANCATQGVFELSDTLSKDQLVRTILEQPTVKLMPDDKNTGVYPQYSIDPLTNLYFHRDQMITTPKGVVISKMNSQQRAAETRVLKFVLERLGVKPLYEVQGAGRLEGGDYIPAGSVEFIGQGLRTNAEAVKQLFDNGIFSAQQVVVVKDQKNQQDEMHLDTYFNVVGKNLAVLGDVRIPATTKPEMYLYADVYTKNNKGQYVKTQADVEFYGLLTQQLGYEVIGISADDQYEHYGTNFLTVGDKEIIAVKGASKAYDDAMKKHGVAVTYVDFDNLRGGWGAAHCTTQVLSRKP